MEKKEKQQNDQKQQNGINMNFDLNEMAAELGIRDLQIIHLTKRIKALETEIQKLQSVLTNKKQ